MPLISDELRSLRNELEVRLLALGERVEEADVPLELGWFRAGPTISRLYWWEFAQPPHWIYGRLTDELTGQGGIWRLPRDPTSVGLVNRLLGAWSDWVYQAATAHAQQRAQSPSSLLARPDTRPAA